MNEHARQVDPFGEPALLHRPVFMHRWHVGVTALAGQISKTHYQLVSLSFEIQLVPANQQFFSTLNEEHVTMLVSHYFGPVQLCLGFSSEG